MQPDRGMTPSCSSGNEIGPLEALPVHPETERAIWTTPGGHKTRFASEILRRTYSSVSR